MRNIALELMSKFSSPIHVAVGVIQVDTDQVLISKRHAHLHQGGLWEFPGGKIDQDESVSQALARELHEELGISIIDTEHLIQIPYDYGDKQVLLDVHKVTRYQGTPVGQEGQELKVVPIAALNEITFPAANKGILAALQLPRICLITGQHPDLPSLLAHLEKAIASGIHMVQFRAHELSGDDYQCWAREMAAICKQNKVILLLNTAAEDFEQGIADGLHLTSERLMACQHRPIAAPCWLGASVHNEQELMQAIAIEADYIFVSPVKITGSHPNAVPLGWDGFKTLAAQAPIPVYALGGMTHQDLGDAIALGAQGIAGISLFR